MPQGLNIPPSRSWQSGNRPGRLDACSVSTNNYRQDVPPKTGRSGRVRVWGFHTVEGDDFSHGVCVGRV